MRKKYIVLSAYIRNDQINHLGSHIKSLEKRKEQNKPKESRKKKIINIKVEIREIENRRRN